MASQLMLHCWLWANIQVWLSAVVIISTEDAVRANSYIDNYKPVVIQVGDASGETYIVRASETANF